MGDCRKIAQECIKAGVREIVWDGRELDWIAPKRCREYLRGVGLKYLVGETFIEAFEKLLKEYSPKKNYRLGLIMPCSYGKPYSQSYIHYMIRSAIKDYLSRGLIHEVIVTNAGIVPRELDEMWPYTSYDWNPAYETKKIKKCYSKVLSCRLKKYLEKNSKYYSKLVSYLRWDSDSWKAVESVSKDLNINIPNLAPKVVPEGELKEVDLEGLYKDEDLILITPTSLRTLKAGLKNILGL